MVECKDLTIKLEIERLRQETNRRLKFREVCKKPNKNTAKIFWRYIKGEQSSKLRLNLVRTEDGNLSSIPQIRKRMLDAHLKEKFNTVPEGAEQPTQTINEDILSDETVKLDDSAETTLLQEFTLEEIKTTP